MPSMSIEPNAMSSPMPQSMPPSRVLAARFSSSWRSLGCTVKPSGTSTNASPSRCSTSVLIAVSVEEWAVASALRAWAAGGSRPVWPSTSVPE